MGHSSRVSRPRWYAASTWAANSSTVKTAVYVTAHKAACAKWGCRRFLVAPAHTERLRPHVDGDGEALPPFWAETAPLRRIMASVSCSCGWC